MKRILIASLLAGHQMTSAQVPDILTHTFLAPPIGTQVRAELGYAVATNGILTAVGAPNDDYRKTDAGLVKVFNSATGALVHSISCPDVRFNSRFGSSLAISGSLLVVGTQINFGSSTENSYVFVYNLDGVTPTSPAFTLAGKMNFGASVAISGTKVLVGAPAFNFNEGRASVFDLSSATPTAALLHLSSSGSRYFGSSVAISGDRVIVGSPEYTAGGLSVGAAFVFDLAGVTPGVATQVLNNPTPAAGDRFGSAVAVDGNRAVIAADSDDIGATNAGSIYLYDFSGGTAGGPVTISNPTPASFESFGSSVAIWGSLIAVCAQGSVPREVFILDAASATPSSPLATMINPDLPSEDSFASSVSISGSIVAVGARFGNSGEGNFGDDAGRAYAFNVGGASPVFMSRMLNPGPSPGDQFGFSVAVAGTRLVVGAHFGNFGRTLYSDGTNYTGSAMIYDLASAAPASPIIVHNPFPDDRDEFGFAVAGSQNYAVVSAPRGGTGNIGRVYVFDPAGATPVAPVFVINNPYSPGTNSIFGASLAMSGSTLVIGTTGLSTATDVGFASVHDLTGSTPTTANLTLSNPEPAAFDSFGYSVAVSGPFVVVGAPGNDTGATNAGSAYVFDLTSPNPTVPSVVLHNPTPEANDSFGQALAISGSRLVVSAPSDNTDGPDVGMVYVYELNSPATAVLTATLRNPVAASSRFGCSVSVSATRVAVGDYGYNAASLTDSGRAYIYDVSSATPSTPIGILDNPSPDFDSQFGYSVAILGNTVAVGVPGDDTHQWDKGAAHIFATADKDSDDDGLLDLWELGYFGSLTARSALNDGDKDGRPELLEQAFNSNPSRADNQTQPTLTVEGQYLTLTLTKRAGALYIGESAGTLSDQAFSPATTQVLIDDTAMLKVRDTVPLGVAGARFVRVKVVAAP